MAQIPNLEQQNLAAAINQAQLEAADNAEATAIRAGKDWLEWQRRKLNKQNFPRFTNRRYPLRNFFSIFFNFVHPGTLGLWGSQTPSFKYSFLKKK